MPVPKPRKKGADPHQPKKTDSDAVAEWRQRMGTPEAKAIYKERASTIETVNAELKTERGLKPFRVRGLSEGAVRGAVVRAGLQHHALRVADDRPGGVTGRGRGRIGVPGPRTRAPEPSRRPPEAHRGGARCRSPRKNRLELAMSRNRPNHGRIKTIPASVRTILGPRPGPPMVRTADPTGYIQAQGQRALL